MCVFVCVLVCVYPMSRADDLVCGPWAGAEVELLDGDTLVVEADVVRAARRPVLDVAQVCVPVDQHVSPTEKPTRSTSASRTAHIRRCFPLLEEEAHLQSREALCRATEKEVIPPCSSPSRGAGEMLEHSRYPQ